MHPVLYHIKRKGYGQVMRDVGRRPFPAATGRIPGRVAALSSMPDFIDLYPSPIHVRSSWNSRTSAAGTGVSDAAAAAGRTRPADAIVAGRRPHRLTAAYIAEKHRGRHSRYAYTQHHADRHQRLLAKDAASTPLVSTRQVFNLYINTKAPVTTTIRLRFYAVRLPFDRDST